MPRDFLADGFSPNILKLFAKNRAKTPGVVVSPLQLCSKIIVCVQRI